MGRGDQILQDGLRVVRRDHCHVLIIQCERLLNHIEHLLRDHDAPHREVALVFPHPIGDFEVTVNAVGRTFPVAEQANEAPAHPEGPAVSFDLLLLGRPCADRRIRLIGSADVADDCLAASCDGKGEELSVFVDEVAHVLRHIDQEYVACLRFPPAHWNGVRSECGGGEE